MAIISPDTGMISYDAYRKAWLETGMLPTSSFMGVIDPYPLTDSERRKEWGYPPYDGDKDKGLNLPCTNKKLLLL